VLSVEAAGGGTAEQGYQSCQQIIELVANFGDDVVAVAAFGKTLRSWYASSGIRGLPLVG
jgi:hypothetical protein